jgi:hypothetical protein
MDKLTDARALVAPKLRDNFETEMTDSLTLEEPR